MTEAAPQAAVHSAQGIDISDFQPVYSGTPRYDFLFFKATEGLTWKARTLAGNVAEARKLGIPFGVYHFLHPGLSGASQARFFMDYVKTTTGIQDGEMLVSDCELMAGVAPRSARSALGIELPDPPNSMQFAAAVSGVDGCNLAFLNEVAALASPRRHPVMTYTMESVGQHLNATAAAHPLLWFAHPSGTAPTAAQIAPFKGWKFWQWGTPGNLDHDAFNGTDTDLHKWLNGYAQHTGPYRHLSDGTKTALQIAQARSTTVEHLAQVSAGAYTPADMAAAAKARIPAGVPFYSTNP